MDIGFILPEETKEEKERKEPIEKYNVGGITFEELMKKNTDIPEYKDPIDYSLQINFDCKVDEEPIKLIGDIDLEDEYEENEAEEQAHDNDDNNFNLIHDENIENDQIGQDKDKNKDKDEAHMSIDDVHNLFQSFDLVNFVKKKLIPKAKAKRKKRAKQNINDSNIMKEEHITYIHDYPKPNSEPYSKPIDFFHGLHQYEVINSNPNLEQNRRYYPLANNTTEVIELNIFRKELLTDLYTNYPSLDGDINPKKPFPSFIYTIFCLNPKTKELFAGLSTGKVSLCTFSRNTVSDKKMPELKHKELKKMKLNESMSKDDRVKVEEETKEVDVFNESPIKSIAYYEDIFVIGNDIGSLYIIHPNGVVPIINKSTTVSAIKILSVIRNPSSTYIDLIVGWKEKAVELITIEYAKNELLDIKKTLLFEFCYSNLAVCVEYYEITKEQSDRQGILIVGSLFKVYFFMLNINKRKSTKISHFFRRNDDCDHPDTCILHGLPPKSKKLNEEKSLSFKTPNPSTMKDYLCISWGKSVYSVDIEKLCMNAFTIEATFTHIEKINRIVALTDNFYGILDKLSDFYVVALYQMNEGTINTNDKPKVNDIKNKDKNDNQPEPKEEPIKFQTIRFMKVSLADYDIRYQSTTLQNLRKVSFYRYSLLSYKKSVIVFGKNQHGRLRLATWMECINPLIDSGQWVKAILLMKEISQTHASLGEKPKNQEDVEFVINLNFQRMISALHLIIPSIADQKKCFLLLLESFLPSQYCLLFLELIMAKIDDDKEQFNLFSDCLEHYILSNQLLNEAIPNTLVEKLIKKYKKHYVFLSNLLMHFRLDIIKTHQQVLEKKNIYHPLIYYQIYKEEGKGNFAFPILYLFNQWESKAKSKSAKSSEEEQIDEQYIDFVFKKDLKTYNSTIVKCDHYLLHLILWYIDYCLYGYKYPSKEEMSSKEFNNIILFIANWIKTQQVIEVLIPFDSFSYFQIISRLFDDFEISSIVSSASESLSNDIMSESSIGFKSIIEAIQVYININKNISIYAKKDYYEFVLNTTKKSKESHFTINDMLEAITFLLNFNQMKKTNCNKEDPFACHQEDISEFETVNYSIERLMLSTLESFPLKNEQINKLLSIPGINEYHSIQVYLYDRINKYTECLKAHLTRYTEDKIMPNQEKKRLLFEWINHTLKSFEPEVKEEIIMIKKSYTTANNFKSTPNPNPNANTTPGSKKGLRHNKSNRSSKGMLEDSDSEIVNKDLDIESKEDTPKGDSNSNSIALNAFKEELLMQLIRLLRIDLQETFLLIDKCFSDKKDYIINQLVGFQDLQLRFVEQCLLSYKDKNINSLKTDDRLYYYSLIKMQIELNCDLKQEERNYEIILNNQDIMDQDMFELLLSREVIECVLVLYLFFGGFADGVKKASESILDVYNKLSDNLTLKVLNESVHLNLIRKLELYIKTGIKLCVGSLEKESVDEITHDLWLQLMNALYYIYENTIIKDRHYINNEKTFFFNQIKNITIKGISTLLTRVSTFMDMTVMINELAIRCNKSVYKEFKYILLQSIKESNQIETILKKAQMLFIHLVEKNIESMLFGLKSGIEVTLEECSKCNQKYDLLNNVIIFKCGHKYHSKCVEVGERNQMICLICQLKQQDKGFEERRVREGFLELNQEPIEENIDENPKVNRRVDQHLKQLTMKLMDKNKVNYCVMELVSNIIII